MKKKLILSRRMARLRSVQALFQMEASGDGIYKVIEDFKSDLITETVRDEGLDEADSDFFRKLIKTSAASRSSICSRSDTKYFHKLVETAVNKQSRIDKLTNEVLRTGWSFNRIDPTLRALFRVAGAEFLMQTAPPQVIINEFVEIAKAFSPDDKASKLVNGVLEHMFRHLNPTGLPNKQTQKYTARSTK